MRLSPALLLGLSLAACAPGRAEPAREQAASASLSALAPPPPPPPDPVASAPPAGSATAAPSAPRPPGPPRYDLRLDDADLPELIRTIGAITGKRFVVSGAPPAIKASLHAPEPVTAEEAYQAFLTILAANGLTVVPRGRFLVVVRSPGFGPTH